MTDIGVDRMMRPARGRSRGKSGAPELVSREIAPMGPAPEPVRRPGRRYFVGIGVDDYDDPKLGLDRAVADVVAVADWFTARAGIEHEQALIELATNPSGHDVLTALGRFLDGLTADDSVVIWFAGHGVAEGARCYLLGRDATRGNAVYAGIPAGRIGAVIGHGKPHNVLVVIDACVAGHLADEIEDGIKNEVRAGNTRDWEHGYLHAVVASTYGRTKALDGLFAEAFLRVVSLEKWTGAVDEWLTVEQVMRGLRSELRDIAPGQIADRTVWGPGAEQLIPNPNYQRRALVGAIAADEFAAHFDPAARGVSAGEAGSYFVGREPEMTAVRAWLLPDKGTGLKVITGSPGAGKSALLARVVLLSDAFGGVVWCHNKTAPRLIEELAAILGGTAFTPSGLIDLAARHDPCTIAVDALDETAGEGARFLAGQVLAPLARTPGIRVLVGTRRQPVHGAAGATDLIGDLGAREGEVIDLDASDELVEIMQQYAEQRLRDASHPGAHDLAGRIARAARPSFLVAAIATRAAIASPTRPDRAYALPTDAGTALDGYIERLADPGGARTLLRPLAWAGGTGLPWGDLWTVLANSIPAAGGAAPAAPELGDDDARRLLDTAGDLIVESSEAAQPRYRLFHEALAEHLRATGPPAPLVHAAIADVLEGTVADGAWSAADRYAVAQLPHHLLGAGRKDRAVEILTDPAWDRARREQARHPLAGAIDAGAAVEQLLREDPGDLRIYPLCHGASRAMATAPPLLIDVIARSGQVVRAQLMANNLTVGSDRMVGYTLLAESFADAGRHDDAVAAVAEVERAVATLPDDHVPMGWSWVSRAARAAGLDDDARRAARASFAAAESLTGDGWWVVNGLFWSGTVARLAGDETLRIRIGELLDEDDRHVLWRNQALQAAAVTGRLDLLRARLDEFLRTPYPIGPIRAGNLALALVDAGLRDEAEHLFRSVDGVPAGSDDSVKRWAWALARSGHTAAAREAVGGIRDPFERSKAIERLVDVALAGDDRESARQLAELAEPLLTAGEPRLRARMVRGLWRLGFHERALALAEQEIAVDHEHGWMRDPRDSPSPHGGGSDRKIARREMVSSAMPVEDERTAGLVREMAEAGDVAAAIELHASMTVPLYRARAGAAIADHHDDPTTATHRWLRALADARLVGRSVVDELTESGRRVFARAGRGEEFARIEQAQAVLDARWDLESFAEQYHSLCRTMAPGPARAARISALMLTPRRLAGERRWDPSAIAAAWATGDDGPRLFVLGLMDARPELADGAILVDAIRDSRSAFEQLQGLRAARRARFDDDEWGGVVDAVRRELAGEPRPDGVVSALRTDPERSRLATAISDDARRAGRGRRSSSPGVG